MAGIFKKFRDLGLASIHSLLDKAIDLNSTAVVKQHVRDLENALSELENGAAEAAGYVRTLNREITELQERVKRLDQTIDAILGDNNPSNDHLATAKQVELNGANDRLTETAQEVADSKTTAAKLDGAVSALKSKHAAMVRQVQKLESMERGNRAKKDAAKAIDSVKEMLRVGEDVSVDSVIARMKSEGDVADEKFDRAMGAMNEVSGKDVAIAEAQAQLEERRKRLQQKQAVQPAS